MVILPSQVLSQERNSSQAPSHPTYTAIRRAACPMESYLASGFVASPGVMEQDEERLSKVASSHSISLGDDGMEVTPEVLQISASEVRAVAHAAGGSSFVPSA